MILIDTSAWVEFLRDTKTPTCEAVDALLDGEFATCDAISMEVLAGAKGEQHLSELRGLLARATLIPTIAADYDEAAGLYRRCRHQGETVRKLIDCLIAAVAIRAGVPVLHAGVPVLHTDSDFAALARHTPLRVYDAETIRP